MCAVSSTCSVSTAFFGSQLCISSIKTIRTANVSFVDFFYASYILYMYFKKGELHAVYLSLVVLLKKNPLIKVQINELESLTCVKGQTCLPHPSPTYFTICPEISGTVANNCPFKPARSSSSSMPIFCCLVQIAEQRRLLAVSAEPQQRVPLLSSHFPRSPLATLIFVDIRQLTSWSRWRTRPPRGTQ